MQADDTEDYTIRQRNSDLSPFMLEIPKEKLRTVLFKGNDMIFSSCGAHFYIEFEGKFASFNKLNGLIFLEHLLKNPERDISLSELYGLVNKKPIELPNNRSLDDAITLYDKLKNLDANSQLDQKLLNVKKSIKEILDISANKRKHSQQLKNVTEQIRQKVSKSIHTTFNMIDEQIPTLGQQLKEKIRAKNYYWKYIPD